MEYLQSCFWCCDGWADYVWVTNPAVPSVRSSQRRSPGEGGAVSHCPTHPVHVPLNNFHVYQDSIPKLDGSCNPVTGDCLTFVMADSG